MEIFELLKNLSETPGPSGFERQVAEVIQDSWKPLVDEIDLDKVGSLVAIKKGQGAEPRSRILLAAHMDEIGLMVKQLLSLDGSEDGSGFLRVTGVGGVDLRHLYGQTVVVHSSAGTDLVGILGSLPAWKLPENKRNKPYDFENLAVDTGKSFGELKKLVSVGDFVSFRQPLRKLLNKRAAGKALDNRTSVASITICLEKLSHRSHDWDVIAVATAQEETRYLGAFTSAYALIPDVAIAIDVTFGKGPGATDDRTFELGDGPTLGLGPNFHPGVHKALNEAAEALEMKVHTEPDAGSGGTDAFGLQIARSGIPTGLVSIPLRYMHTMVESVALADVERVGRLLAEFVVRLDENFLDNITGEMIDTKDGKK
ncbi:MAG: M42 family peptidase [Chloroflexota bacterium]|jgi:endoglucanase